MKAPVWRVAALAATLTAAPIAMVGHPSWAPAAKPHPVRTSKHTVGFVATPAPRTVRAAAPTTQAARPSPAQPAPSPTTTPGATSPTSSSAADGASAVAPVQEVAHGVAVVGVTWPDATSVSTKDQFQIRTLTHNSWGTWETLDRDSSHGPDTSGPGAGEGRQAQAERGTQPYVVSGATQFQVRAVSTDGTAPTKAQVQVVDPGTSTADAAATPAPGSAAAAGAMPQIYSRAQWGADESLRRAAPEYGQVQVAYVHHTDGSNDYTPDQVPAIIRGIYAYHVQGNGWNDIGYNFLIDRFGRIWEGRYGGVDKPVIGAHTLNYNQWSTGVSAIGNFVSTTPSQAIVDAYKRLFAWKLGISGVPATGTVFVKDKTFNRISGHRDAFQTTCPGQALYDKLPEIRSGTAALEGSLARSMTLRDIDHNGAPDVLSYAGGTSPASMTGSVSVLAAASPQPVQGGVQIGAGWNALRNAVLTPDMTGDGKPDIVAQDPAGNRLRIYSGNGTGGFAGVAYRGAGWNAMTRIIAAGDRNRDGANDLLATNANGDLVYYPGNGHGWVYNGRIIGRGWTAIASITNAGDLNGDGITDLLATRKSDGALLMYSGRPDGSVNNGVQWGAGWGAMSPLLGAGDADKDGHADLFVRESSGVMRSYYSDADGRLTRMNRWGAGWNGLNQLSSGVDWNGDGRTDIVGVAAGVSWGQLRLYAGTGARDFTARANALPAVPGADVVRLVGDVDGDGNPDAVARVASNDSLVLLRGQSDGTFAAPAVVSTGGWNAMDLIESAGDLDYDGVPDLLARDGSGNLYLYPFRRDGSLADRSQLGSGWGGMLSVVGAGAFNNDANGDVVALRASDHALVLYPGGGSAPLQDAFVMASGQNDLTQIIGVGDFNGDGPPDILAEASDGHLWLYSGNGYGGLYGGRMPINGGEGAGHVLG